MMGKLFLGSPTNAGWFLPEPSMTTSANRSLSTSALNNRIRRPPWFGSGSRIYTNTSNSKATPTLRRSTLKSGGEEGEASEYSDRRRMEVEDWVSLAASPYQILGVDSSCTPAQLKAAFRARVKEFHPDVCKDMSNSDAIIRRVIQAYEMLSQYHISETTERDCLDPFEEPECEAFDLFVNELLCVGRGCPYSCVHRAPHAFSFTSENGTARATTQGHGGDYQVQLAVGQCPRRCIHYVTPLQRAILEELLYSVLNAPYDPAEAAVLDSLIAKARFENNRYQPPKKQPKASSEYVDWY